MYMKGVAHRDLSLENVLIKNDKERGHICLIIDFGMSVFVPKDDVSGNFLKARPLGNYEVCVLKIL